MLTDELDKLEDPDVLVEVTLLDSACVIEAIAASAFCSEMTSSALATKIPAVKERKIPSR
ncbi:hypothetical protein FD20_GL001534 [Liquorilactobacillus uvarum DSM 19971]|uniref:Uncharacterized protein n=1 Tax=Liquorilactobacillus uvarum DSM 19971 TaxID=1423812 RepID=A0A0R1PR09_9LACO|nr:hypothetical protein FD20_GL001534 [Liquorilactobacillus uvarum DSM 19971]